MSYECVSYELVLWRMYKLEFWRISPNSVFRLKRDYEKIVEKELAKRSLQLPRPVLVKPVEACDNFEENSDLYIQCLYVLHHVGGELTWQGQW